VSPSLPSFITKKHSKLLSLTLKKQNSILKIC